ncbi:hypothetical protein QUB68_03600 [Microcoleus sp. A006_D1]|uniref:hypothetical protein n=1 Tax=Microcoleus sp. A006_D1 TaxID=3055267 RepID=UPI002FD2EE0E
MTCAETSSIYKNTVWSAMARGEKTKAIRVPLRPPEVYLTLLDLEMFEDSCFIRPP